MSVVLQCYSVITDSGISASGHGKELFYGLNAIDKRYVYKLMSNVQLPVSKIFYSQVLMHSCTKNNYVSLAKYFQNKWSKEHCKHGIIDKVKYRKRASTGKCTDRDYHLQDNADVSQKDVKMYCDTNQFPVLPFCGPHPKPHGARGLSKYYNLRFDIRLGHGICAIFHIPCECVVCTSILDQPWVMVYFQINKYATNLSQILLTGQFWAHITTVISFT